MQVERARASAGLRKASMASTASKFIIIKKLYYKQ